MADKVRVLTPRHNPQQASLGGIGRQVNSWADIGASL